MNCDYLTVGYDESDKDYPAIAVFRKHGKYLVCLKCLVGDEAKELHDILINQIANYDSKEQEHE